MSLKSLIHPSSIQVLEQFKQPNNYGWLNSDMRSVVATGTERLRTNEKARRKRLRQTTMGVEYDTSSLTWALGISIGLFLLITLLRNR